MSALYISPTGTGNGQVVHRPRPADPIGAALRGAFGDGATLPPDILRLLQNLDRTR